MHPTDLITTLPHVGPKLQATLGSMTIHTIQDLLDYYPSRYLDFTKFTPIEELHAGEVVTIRGHIKNIAARFSFRTRKMLAEGIISDNTGSIKITWFNQGYVADALKKGDEVLLSGKVDQYKGLQLTNPVYEKVSEENIHTGRLVPVYKLPDTIFPKTFRKLVHDALGAADLLEDNIPPHILEAYHLPSKTRAVQELHFPTTLNHVEHAQQRLAFEENLIQQLAVVQHKLELQRLAAPSIAQKSSYVERLKKLLPFTLTSGQSKALASIISDLEAKHPMNRLLQGDVGSGKTIVALLAALTVTRAGFQVAILAPTEVLAKQHFQTIQSLLSTLEPSLTTTLLTRNFHEINHNSLTKKEVLNEILKGTPSLVVGTHALLQESVRFKNLALVIIDEQHRFGVEQRRRLAKVNTASHSDTAHPSYPHLLSMSATPIPRTAALTLYGDLEISTITELPKNRLPIKTWVVPEPKRGGAYNFIRNEVTAQRQAFIITPLVEESEKLDTKAAKVEFVNLRTNLFPDLRLGLLYGSMKGAEKDATMLSFKNKEIDILVATSVIEIGIDIPNASVIMIEGADRFGLAQLHQLRGRVGRGPFQSYCLLFTDVPSSQDRLEFLARTNNGFTLAEYDMNTRGFGSLFGTLQTGFNFKYGQHLTLTVLENAKTAARQLTDDDPELTKYPALKGLAKPLSEALHME